MRIEVALRRAQESAAPEVGRGLLGSTDARLGMYVAGLAALDAFTTYSDWTVF